MPSFLSFWGEAHSSIRFVLSLSFFSLLIPPPTHTHTHTHLHIRNVVVFLARGEGGKEREKSGGRRKKIHFLEARKKLELL
jgi:hypothetical protein